MQTYFKNIYQGVKSLVIGMKVTWKHFYRKKELVATLQYPHETWPIPEKNIGFEENDYNLIRSRLLVDIDDCIGCLQCERACPVDCIKIDTIKPPKGSEFDCGITSNDTQKKMIVSRFTIDMAECCYCNLCAYPCPEECIYMVGGPNSHKHEMDYEFGKYERDGLLYEFADASEEDILAVGGEKYLEKKKNRASELENALELVELAAEKAQQEVDNVKEDSSTEQSSEGITKEGLPKYNFGPLNKINQKSARGIAKRTFAFGFRKNKTPEEVISLIKDHLNQEGLYSADYDQYIDALKELPLVGSASNQIDNKKKNNQISESKDENKSNELEVKAVSSDNLDIKILSALDDKMARGIAKKAFLSAKREKLDASGHISKIEDALSEAGLSSDANSEIIKKLRGDSSLNDSENNELEVKAVSSDNLDIKILSALDDKMARGIAKKAFLSAKREKLDASGHISKIEDALSEAGLSSDANSEIIKRLLG